MHYTLLGGLQERLVPFPLTTAIQGKKIHLKHTTKNFIKTMETYGHLNLREWLSCHV